jgi:hypothetical protein
MRRLLVPLLVGMLAVLVVGVPCVQADDSTGLDFSSSLEGGLLLYNGYTQGSLNGSRIPITSVGLFGGPSDAVSGLTCGSSSCGWLNFTTGTLLSSGPGSFTFNGGGMVTVLGTVPGQSGAATTLVSGLFVGPVTVTQIGSDTWEMVGSVSVTSASSSITALFPNLKIPTTGSLDQLVIVFNMRPNGTFSATAAGTSLFVSTAPEASSMVLFGSGLVGVGYFLRRKRKVKAPRNGALETL